MIALSSPSCPQTPLNHPPSAAPEGGSPTEIDLAEPFDRVLANVLSLPHGSGIDRTNRTTGDAEFKRLLRGLYEAANGRQVETPIGFVAIAPPVAAFLRRKPFQVATQIDLLVEAATRIIAGPKLCESATILPNNGAQSTQRDSALAAEGDTSPKSARVFETLRPPSSPSNRLHL
jgi:hypothetical protein